MKSKVEMSAVWTEDEQLVVSVDGPTIGVEIRTWVDETGGEEFQIWATGGLRGKVKPKEITVLKDK